MVKNRHWVAESIAQNALVEIASQYLNTLEGVRPSNLSDHEFTPVVKAYKVRRYFKVPSYYYCKLTHSYFRPQSDRVEVLFRVCADWESVVQDLFTVSRRQRSCVSIFEPMSGVKLHVDPSRQHADTVRCSLNNSLFVQTHSSHFLYR